VHSPHLADHRHGDHSLHPPLHKKAAG
jgi:hypothetical protein